MLADIIVMERGHMLDFFINEMEAFGVNNVALYKKYMAQMYDYGKKAEQARQEFKAKYGY